MRAGQEIEMNEMDTFCIKFSQLDPFHNYCITSQFNYSMHITVLHREKLPGVLPSGDFNAL